VHAGAPAYRGQDLAAENRKRPGMIEPMLDLSFEEENRLLARVDILQPLPPQEVGWFARRSTVISRGQGETFDVGEDRRRLIILVGGRVRVYEPDPCGQELTLSVVEGGTIVGQSGFAVTPSRKLRVEALEASIVRVLGWEDLEALVRRNPEVGIELMRVLSARLGVCEDRLSDLVRKEVPARLAGLVLKLSETQGVVTPDGGRKIPTRYTHRQLGTMIGANREAVTRALERLRREGSVEIRDRRIHVTDAEALERLAESRR
jgi:CRP/FNR family transcriptional regulator, cyclic AMP receptor protein